MAKPVKEVVQFICIPNLRFMKLPNAEGWEAFIDYEEHYLDNGKPSVHVWARRMLGTVSDEAKQRMQKVKNG